MAAIDDCVLIIKPVVTRELEKWDLFTTYIITDDEYKNACSGAISELLLEEISVNNSLYSRLRSYLAISSLFVEKLRVSGDYIETTSVDSNSEVNDITVKLHDIQITEKKSSKSGTTETVKKNDYSLSKAEALGFLANKYNQKYKDLLKEVIDDLFCGSPILE